MSHESDAADFPTKGRWLGATQMPGYSSGDETNPDGAFGVHAVLMHTGRVLFFSGYYESQGYPYRSWSWDPDPDTPITDAIGRWFVPGFDGASPPHPPPPTVADDPDIDLFCAHHVALEDGRILVIGGDAEEAGRGHDNRGLHIYDPRTEQWSRVSQRMMAGRWYPTAVVLADGAVAVFSGWSEGPRWVAGPTGHGILEEVEVMRPPSYAPSVVNGGRRKLYIYPGMHLVRGGRVFAVPTTWRIDDLAASSTVATVAAAIGTTSGFRLAGTATGVWDPPLSTSPPVLPSNVLREEGTSVLLPPARDGRILVIGGGFADRSAETQHGSADTRSCEILETQGANPRWVPAGRTHHPRVNVTAVLLPDGKVLIIGGHDTYKFSTSHNHSNVAEMYDPSVTYDPADPSGAFTELAEMHQPRIYHGTALLLPDGRVLVAGGEHTTSSTGTDLAQDNTTMEFYEPPYLHRGEQPRILDPLPTRISDVQIRYGDTFEIEYEAAAGATIDKLVMMRPGSTTHHTDTEQRYEDIGFSLVAAGRLRAQVPSDPTVIPPGFYMIWIVDDSGRPCERAVFARVSQEACSIITDRSHFSILEYQSTANAAGVAEFSGSTYVILHGFIPSQVGITTANPTGATLSSYAPSVAVTDGGAGVSGISIYPIRMLLEDPSGDLDVRQRITFEYGVRITTEAVFPAAPADPSVHVERVLDLATQAQGYSCKGQIRLVRDPNPFMLDGPTHWLSTDVRVFQVSDGANQSGVALSSSDTPFDYLNRFLTTCRITADSASHLFRLISEDQQQAKLELAPTVGGSRVLNFAIAKVRMKAPTSITANDVHMFFRLFTTQAASLQYATTTYPRSSGPITYAQAGQTASEILTIPCYGVTRSTVATAGDTPNIQNIAGAGGAERHAYYGAWLDINQTTPQIVDPADGTTKSVQALIKGRHQCLVSEIYYDRDPVPINATPAGNDNLSQRNLAIVESANPGTADSHTVVHTFDLEPTWSKPQTDDADPAIEQPLTATHLAMATIDKRDPGRDSRPDELMIFWGDLPADSEATLYFPDLDADEIVERTQAEGRPGVIEAVDANTVRCQIADVTYVPLPGTGPQRLAGLLAIQLPNTVRSGDRFRVSVHQYSRLQSRLIGAFEVLIPIQHREAIRAEAVRTLAVMRHVSTQLPAASRWRPLFDRYLEALADRVRGLGIDPGRIPPSAEGAELPDETRPRPDRPTKASLCKCIVAAIAGVLAAKILVRLLRCLCRPRRC